MVVFERHGVYLYIVCVFLQDRFGAGYYSWDYSKLPSFGLFSSARFSFPITVYCCFNFSSLSSFSTCLIYSPTRLAFLPPFFFFTFLLMLWSILFHLSPSLLAFSSPPLSLPFHLFLHKFSLSYHLYIFSYFTSSSSSFLSPVLSSPLQPSVISYLCVYFLHVTSLRLSSSAVSYCCSLLFHLLLIGGLCMPNICDASCQY